MAIYKPTELHAFLRELGIAPKKGLSQNFLIDGNILRKIAAASCIEAGDLVVEIGPGPGSLTEELLRQGASVLAVEKDAALASVLKRLQREGGQEECEKKTSLKVFCDDIMTFPLEETLAKEAKGKLPVKVIANLPYHLTTPIIAKLVPHHHLFSSLVLMVQEEVARRFVAKPGTSEYSSFTLFLNFYCRPRYAFTVSRNCFYPSPKVDSAIVILDLKPPPAVSNVEAFFKLTRTAFAQRRKMLKGSLRSLYPQEAILEALGKLKLSPNTRPEELSLEQFLLLFEALEGDS